MAENKKRHANIPVFIPHEGCPNGCVFCNQRKIAGSSGKAYRDISFEVENALSTMDLSRYEDIQIAFFGGSFTGIDRESMLYLLESAKRYIDLGKVSSLRLSTRPDYINEEILDILSLYGVKDIELGIQSMSDAVLYACKRNHTAKDTEKACSLINSYGFRLTGQMMIGLPGSSGEDEIFTAEEIVRMNSYSARIYPTVVLSQTELWEMTKQNIYTPLHLSEAVERSADVYEVFLNNRVKVLRVGLQSGTELRDKDVAIGETAHSALGEMCESEVYYRRIIKKFSECAEFSEREKIKKIIIYCPLGETSKVSGQHAFNKQRIAEYLNNQKLDIKIKENNMEKFCVDVKISE